MTLNKLDGIRKQFINLLKENNVAWTITDLNMGGSIVLIDLETGARLHWYGGEEDEE